MEQYKSYYDAFKIECSPVAKKQSVITSGNVRITVITPSLLRVENSKNGLFCDEPTQSVWFRDFCETQFQSETRGSLIKIITDEAEFCYNTSAKKMKYIKLSDGRTVTNYISGNLKGTRRTLDQTFGKVKIGDGIISKNGVAVLDDSKSLVIDDEAQIVPKKSEETDVYYFAYGYNYANAVADFFKLTGNAPLVPRFSLGNWWSRYKAYTQDEYVTLMQRFIDEEIPITVATVDMDWHWVDVKKKFGSESVNQQKTTNVMEKFYDQMSAGGWTGYSWNTDLFPDPKGFLDWLKGNNFKVTMNLHPATGIRWFEDCYKSFAEYMGDNPDDKKQYAFDITDKKFTEGYFKLVHKPHQDMGVDFWWIDWQQGHKTKVPGLDPLWALNHYHSMDIARDKDRRPLILSRFAGAGSHRYPLGFSGDTAQNWQVLDFQPYFTSTASNIGYTWWSHDIGGHHQGYKDDELYLRWVQYGVFSPIMRLHSTLNEFLGKEPWKYSSSVCSLAIDALRLRHRMLPYLYTMNYKTSFEGKALVEPMYYGNPTDDEAYSCPNEYRFGTELIVAPITHPKDKHTNLASTEVWLPQGRYTDIFNGRIYNGNRKVTMYRDEASIPVLAKEGAIIPLDVNDRNNNCGNPEALEILIYRGNGSFKMYEDDGETLDYKKGKFAFTDFDVTQENNAVSFAINPVRGDKTVVPQSRSYILSFRDIENADVSVTSSDNKFEIVDEKGYLKIKIDNVAPTDRVTVKLSNVSAKTNGSKREMLIELISKFQGKNTPKAKIYTDYVNGKGGIPFVSDCFTGPIKEIEAMFSE